MAVLPIIMHVEDDDSDLEITRLAFQELGVPVKIAEARSGRQAIEQLARRADGDGRLPQLVLLDLNLPTCPGQEVLSYIRHQSSLRHIPVVVLTTSTSIRDRRSCSELGADEYLVKPDRFTDFVALMAHVWSLLPTQDS